MNNNNSKDISNKTLLNFLKKISYIFAIHYYIFPNILCNSKDDIINNRRSVRKY